MEVAFGLNFVNAYVQLFFILNCHEATVLVMRIFFYVVVDGNVPLPHRACVSILTVRDVFLAKHQVLVLFGINSITLQLYLRGIVSLAALASLGYACQVRVVVEPLEVLVELLVVVDDGEDPVFVEPAQHHTDLVQAGGAHHHILVEHDACLLERNDATLGLDVEVFVLYLVKHAVDLGNVNGVIGYVVLQLVNLLLKVTYDVSAFN